MSEISLNLAKDFVLVSIAGSDSSHSEPLSIAHHLDFSEIEPQQIWNATTRALQAFMSDSGVKPSEIISITLKSDLDMTVLWDNETLGAVCLARHDERINSERIAWMIEANPSIAGTKAAGRLESGTEVDYLITRMTRGLHTSASELKIVSEPTGFIGISAQIIV